MKVKIIRFLTLFLGLAIGFTPHLTPRRTVTAASFSPSSSQPLSFPSLSQSANVPQVNVPYFNGDVTLAESATFWFGEVTPSANAMDVRVGYNDRHLFLRVTAFDRRIWYDATPSAETFHQWDGVTLYLDTTDGASTDLSAASYRFDAQLSWWESREAFQVAYSGASGDWIREDVPFNTDADWQGDAPNNSGDDRGWAVSYTIPFASLGLDGPPTKGTLWRLGVVAHDRDAQDRPPEAEQRWPPALQPQDPNTWGRLHFGNRAYEPPEATPASEVIIREGLDGAVVPDAAVGGGTTCGGGGDYWTEWGTRTYGQVKYFNVQNQVDVSDWPCFSRYYVTFPLASLPENRTVLSATLRFHLFGNAGEGWDPPPRASLIQVFTVSETWDEATLTWNNAPQAQENVAAQWVDPVDEYPGLPGIPYDWDVSGAVADAYAHGRPLRLALWEADTGYHSGKYFHSSEEEEYNALGRPTLIVTLGRPAPDVDLHVLPPSGHEGDTVAFTFRFNGTGVPLTLTNTLPEELGAPQNIEITGSDVAPHYDPATHRLTWQASPAAEETITLQYRTTINTPETKSLANTIHLTDADGYAVTKSISVLVNAHHCYLPLISRR